MTPKLPGVPHRKAVRAFERAGFHVERESKHIIMNNGERTITIPRHDPINAFTMADIVRSAGMTIERFQKLL